MCRPALLLGQDVGLRLEARVRRDRARLRQHLPALHLLAPHAAQQTPHIVARLARIQQLAEHLNARARRLRRLLDTDDLHLVAHLHLAPLDPARHHRAAPRDREHILHRHQKRQVLRPLRLRDVAIHRRHQLQHRVLALHLVAVLQRRQRRAPDHRHVVARKLVGRQQLPHLELDQVQQLLIVNLVHFVQIHHQRRYPHLARQKNMLARLRHRPVRRRNNQDRPVHLRCARDHVLHVIRMARAIHMRVMAVLRLVLHMRRRNRDAPRLLLRRLVNRINGTNSAPPDAASIFVIAAVSVVLP